MTGPNEVGARLILSGGPAFKAEAESASASVTELGTATKRAGMQARDSQGRFVSSGDKIAATGVKASTAGKRVTAFGDTMVVAGNKTAAAGRKMTRWFTLPVVAVGAVSVNAATKFNASMTRIQTQAGASSNDVKILSKDVLNMAKTAQQGPQELADSLYHLKSVGMDNVDAMKALGQASKLAAVSGAPLEQTTNALAGAWRTGIKGAGSFGEAVGTLNAIVGAGNMKMDQLNAALGTGILPSAKTFGLSMKDVGAALALFTDEGVPAQAAATRLRMTFSLLGAPTDQARAQLRSIGLTQYQLASDMRKPNGLVRAIGDLKSHLEDPKYHKNLNEQAGLLSRAFGGGRSSSAILSMINNYDVLKLKQAQVTRSTGKFGEAVKKQAETPQAQFKKLEANLQRLGVVFGNLLLPYVLKGVVWLGHMMDRFNGLSNSTKKWIGYGVLVLAVLGPFLFVGGKLIKMIGLASKVLGLLAANPIILVIALLAIGFYLLYTRSAAFRKAVQSVSKELKELGQQVLNKVLLPLFRTFSTILQNVHRWVEKHRVGLTQFGHVVLAIVVFALKVWITYLKIVVTYYVWLAKIVWAVVKGIAQAIYWVVNQIGKHWRQVYNIMAWPFRHIPAIVALQLAMLPRNVRRVVNSIESFFRKLPKRILSHGPEWLKAGAALGGMLWKGLSSLIQDASGIGKSLYNAVAETINRDLIAKIKDWKFTIGDFGVEHTFVPFGGIPDIPLLAKGGPVEAAKPYIVGERGPELFIPSAAGNIMSNQKFNSMRDRRTVDVNHESSPRVKVMPVGQAIKTTPYQVKADAAGTVRPGDGDTKTFILQTVMDKRVVAEATYEYTRDKVARK